MRLDPKTAALFATGTFLFLLIFGVGWPGPGAWLLAFALLSVAAGALAWWLDGAAMVGAGAVSAQGASPFHKPNQSPFGRTGGGVSRLLVLGLPGPDASGRWVMPGSVHVAAIAGLTGLLALVIFIGDVVGGGGDGDDAPPVASIAPQSTEALDFAVPVAPPAAASTDATAVPPLAETASASQLAQADSAPIVVETPSNPQPVLTRPIDVVDAPRGDENSIVYQVVAGDTLYDLAITYGVTVEEIMDANRMDEFDMIFADQLLFIPQPQEAD